MTETTESSTAAAPAETPKKGKAKAAKKGSTTKVASKKGKTKAEHPPTAQMVNEAIEALNEKKGSSLHAIKKYISANYKLDASKANKFILKYLRSAVLSGKLVQSKGTGANGSFRFPGKDKPAPKKKSSPKKAKKAVAKKEPAAPAKKTTPKKKPAPKKAPVKAKSPAKPKAKKLKVSTAKPKKASPAKKPAKSGKKKASPKKK